MAQARLDIAKYPTLLEKMAKAGFKALLVDEVIVSNGNEISKKALILEKKFSISIPDEEASPQAFDTVTSIISLVERHLAKKGK